MGYIERMIKRLFDSIRIQRDDLLWGRVSLRFLLFILVVLASFLILGTILLLHNGNVSEVDGAFTFSKTVLETGNEILTPFIASIAVVTTFLAFIVQYKANQKQRDDIKRERFESRFYEMLRLHRANVEEMEIDGRYTGRRVFLKMHAEYRFIYQLLERIVNNRNEEVPEAWKAQVAYHHCFWGVFSNTEPLSRDEFYETFEIELIIRLNAIRRGFRKHKSNLLKEDKSIVQFPFLTKEKIKNQLKVDFMPFGGHSSRLGHYYRHLYQTVKLAVTDIELKAETSEKEFENRYAYVKLLRVQLSNHEQAMIYFNSFFVAGNVWWLDSDYKNPWGMELSYFLDYAFVKNLPFNLTRGLGPEPVALFREKLEERSYPADHTRIKKFSTIEKKLDWLFEWRGG